MYASIYTYTHILNIKIYIYKYIILYCLYLYLYIYIYVYVSVWKLTRSLEAGDALRSSLAPAIWLDCCALTARTEQQLLEPTIDLVDGKAFSLF